MGLGRVERVEQAVTEGPFRRVVGLEHGRPHGLASHDVRLAGHAVGGNIPRERDAALTGMRGDSPLGIDHRYLACGSNRILGEKAPQGLGRGQPRRHQLQATRAIGDLGVGLSGHGTDPDPRPRDDRADREPVRLDGDAELAGPRIAGDDRVGALPGAVADESTPRDDVEHIALTAFSP